MRRVPKGQGSLCAGCIMVNEKESVKKRIHELREQIEYHTHLYYDLDAPVLSDYEFNQLMLELKKLERENPELITPDSPTQKVGGKRVMGVAVEHVVPMQSLLDVFNEEEVEAFMDGMLDQYPDATFSVEAKIDGLSLSLQYENDKLTVASTRGDGAVGEDVTANVVACKDIPNTLHVDGVNMIEVRCECYMSTKDFEIANTEQEENGKPSFANARNCAAGSLRQLNPAISAKRNLQVLAFNVQQATAGNTRIPLFNDSHTLSLETLEKAGMPVVPHFYCQDKASVLAAIEKIHEMRPNLPYGIDGAVVKIDRLSMREEIGVRAKNPKWAVAYKYPPEEKETVVREIVWQTGRTGRITPVGITDPIALAGSTVDHVTLHNPDYVHEKDVRVGDTIVMFKSGDVIPKLKHVVLSKRPESIRGDENATRIPEVCPVCGGKVGFLNSKDGNGQSTDLFCLNDMCPAKALNRLTFFASKECMDIDGFGPAVAQKLIDAGYIADIGDAFTLAQHREQLIRDNVIGRTKTVDNLLGEIEKAKTQNADKVLKSFGWKGVGGHVAKALLEKYQTIPAVFACKKEEITGLDGIGPVLADAVMEMIGDPAMNLILKKMQDAGVNMEYKAKTQSNSLAGKTFVITGTLPTLERKEAQALIEKNGGKVTGSVSKKTSYLLAGEAAGSKLEKAKTLGIPVIREDDLFAMIGEPKNG